MHRETLSKALSLSWITGLSSSCEAAQRPAGQLPAATERLQLYECQTQRGSNVFDCSEKPSFNECILYEHLAEGILWSIFMLKAKNCIQTLHYPGYRVCTAHLMRHRVEDVLLCVGSSHSLR